MDGKKICFIICVNDDVMFRECLRYIHWLLVPEGITVEILEIRDAVSMTAGYNEGMACSNAEYKVYLHQDVFIRNRYFIYDIMQLFETDRQIGMIGMVGSPKMPLNGVMWNGERVMQDTEKVSWEEYRYHLEDGYWEVDAVDGLLMATRYDMMWREDLFDGWDFYDASQSFEMKRRKWKVIVPKQRSLWFIHDDKEIVKLWNYNKYRERFLAEYAEELLEGTEESEEEHAGI